MNNLESAKVLILAKDDITTADIKLNCRCKEISLRRISILGFYSIAKDCYQALNWNVSKIEVPLRSIISTFLKLAIKRRPLLRYKIFEYEFMHNLSCSNHALPSQFNSWYSTSASRLGFPWTRDTFFNSLSIFRDNFFDLYCFGYSGSIYSSYQIGENVELFPVKISSTGEMIGKWNSTKFFQFENASIIHGNVLLSNSVVFLKDFSLQSYRFPPHMIPNSVWLNPLEVETCFTPAIKEESVLHGSHIFLDANANLYHFIAESIRVLVFVLQEGLEFQGIVIRDNLPNNFYNLIEYIVPGKAIYKVKQGEKVSVPKIIACGFETPASQKSGFFSRQGDVNFKNSDDFIPFAFIRQKFLFHFAKKPILGVSDLDQVKRKVLISIRPLHSSRGFFFSKLVSRVLKFLGALVIDLNALSFSETLELMQTADYFFCESGAGVVNILFGQPDLEFVEISFGNNQNWITLASALEIHHEEVRVSSLFRIICKDYLDSNPFPLVNLLYKYFIVRPVLRNL